MDVGKRFRQLREKKFPTVDAFAAHAKMPRSTVSSFENNQGKNGKRSSPQVDTIEKFIKHLPCSLAEFFEEESPKVYRVPSGPPKHLTQPQAQYVDMLVEIMGATPIETDPGDETLIAALHSNLTLFVRDAREYHFKQKGEATKPRSGPISIQSPSTLAKPKAARPERPKKRA